MIACRPADIPVAFSSPWRDHDNSALLQRIPGDECLPESLPHGGDGVHHDARGHQRPPTVPHLQRVVGVPLGIREQRTGEMMFVAERAGLCDCAVSNHDEFGAERPDSLALRDETSDLLAAEQSAEVPDEYQDRGALRPELTEANVLAVRILDRHAVEQVRHLQRLSESFLKTFAVAAAQRQLRAVSQVDGALAGERRSQLFDALDVDDRLAMNTDEVQGIEL